LWEWKFVELKNLASPFVNTTAEIYPTGQSIDGYTSNTTTDLEFIIVRIGDRTGVACDN